MKVPNQMFVRNACTAVFAFSILSAFALTLPAAAEETQSDAAVAQPATGWPHRWVTSLASGSGRLCAGVADGLLLRESSVVTFDAGDPTTSQTLYSHPVSVWAIAISPDGSSVASTDYKGNFVVYQFADKQQTMKEAIFERWTRGLAYAPDGASIVAANEAGKVFVYDIAKGEVSQSVELDGQQIYSISVAPDGQSLAACDGAGSVHLLKLPTLEPIKKVACGTEPAWAVCFTADGKQVVTGGADRQLRSFAVEGDAEPKVLGKATDWITAIVRDPASSQIAVGSLDGTMFTTDGTSVDTIGKAPSGIWSVAYSDGKLLAATRKHMVTSFVPSWKVGYTAPDETK